MVAESTGVWDADAMIVLKHVAQAVAAQSGEDPATCSSLLLHELGVFVLFGLVPPCGVMRRRSKGVAR